MKGTFRTGQNISFTVEVECLDPFKPTEQAVIEFVLSNSEGQVIKPCSKCRKLSKPTITILKLNPGPLRRQLGGKYTRKVEGEVCIVCTGEGHQSISDCRLDLYYY